MGIEETDKPPAGSLAAAVSRRLVQLVSEYTGRGPSRARAVVARDHILVFFSETLTRQERTLIAAGHREMVLQARRAVYDAMRAPAVDIVQELTGRQVACALGDSEIDPDVSIALFVFAQETADRAYEEPTPARRSPCQSR